MSLPGPLREGTPADAVDGIVPMHVAIPTRAQELAAVLSAASSGGLRTVLRGGGTKLGWGRTPAGVDLVIETGSLRELVAHRHGDMTATVQAGMPLEQLNRRLGERDQCLPIESAFDAATIGGVLATNDCGPLRHRFGTPRDLLIGVTLATTDGRLVKAGGTVVKNVAGYDLGRLVTGSCGSLAVIVDATFKLLPIPSASSTLVVTYPTLDALARDVDRLGGSQVELVACDVRVGDGQPQLLARTASSPQATLALHEQARQLVSGATASLTGDAERACWSDQIRSPWANEGTIVRLSWLPANLGAVLDAIGRLDRHGCRALHFTGRAIGAGLLRIDGDDRACALAIADLRASTTVGHVVVLRASGLLKRDVDVWGPPSTSSRMALALKRMFDPAGILNAGRGPI